jgi:phosphatidylinositol glycan class O
MPKQPTSAQRAEYNSISRQWAAAKAARDAEQALLQPATAADGSNAPRAQEQDDDDMAADGPAGQLAQEQIRFTVRQGLLMAWFAMVAMLHFAGLYLFMSGFLLSRMVLEDKSTCEVPPVHLETKQVLGSPEVGCWHPKTFDKAVVIVIDALRYDFTVPRSSEVSPRRYHDALTVLYETAVARPEHALLLPFIADPPTATLQRLKGLTTGTLPTFVEGGSNLGGEAILEDNLIAQLRSANKKVVHLGDDTWHALFPGYFEEELTRPYESFNVWDLHTVDNGVAEHLIPLLERENTTRWDFLVGHLLGVDHAGHRFGPDHVAMEDKLKQMDGFVRHVMSKIDDDTLLVVLGDHGMDAKGDHGGESDEEIEAALWMYSKKPMFGRRKGEVAGPPSTAKDRRIPQIDLVPTLSLLLGLPIPFNNLGAPIYEAFAGPTKSPDLENVSRVHRLAAAQLSNYMKKYTAVRKLDDATTEQSAGQLRAAEMLWDTKTGKLKATNTGNWEDVYRTFHLYQRETLELCRALWAQFNVPNMIQGIGVLASTLVLLILYARGTKGKTTDLHPILVRNGGVGLIAGAAIGVAVSFATPKLALIGTTVLSIAVGTTLGSAYGLFSAREGMTFPIPRSSLSWVSVIFTVGLSMGFASNSYTIWEDRIVLFFLTTISALLFAASLRQDKLVDRTMGCYHSIVFALLTRAVSLSRLCREEQMPYCESTYYLSSGSSTAAAWHLAAPVAAALILPGILKDYYKSTQSYHHSAIIWYDYAFRAALWLAASFWILNTADDHGWITSLSSGTVKTLQVMIAQTTLGVSVAVGYSIFTWSAPFLQITTHTIPATPATTTTDTPQTRPLILGLANIHGTRHLPLLAIWTAATILLQKPLGAGTTAILLWQILCLLECLSATSLQSSSLGPVALALLASLHFFATGHQATFASIQWDAAFIPLHSIRQPWSALFLVFNTLGPHIICCLAAPLIPLWRAPARQKGLLSAVARAFATHLVFYGTVGLATSLWAYWLRRHLMLFRVFCPRWLVGGVILVVVHAAGLLLGLGGLRWWGLSVGEIMGMPD